MSPSRGPFAAAHRRMLARFGPLHWWPAASPFEVIVGAVLVQNTAWSRVEEAIARLDAAGRLTPRSIHELDEEALAALVRPAGTFRVKAKRLRAVVDWLVRGYGGDVALALDGGTEEKRRELLGIHGVGRETADSILLYAGGHATFVVDAYTRRILLRHALLAPGEGDDAVRERVEAELPPDPAVYGELHAQLVTVGKSFCRPRRPRCSACPLEFLFEVVEEPPTDCAPRRAPPREEGGLAGSRFTDRPRMPIDPGGWGRA